MRGNHAAQVCEAWRTWEGSLCEVTEDSATLSVQKAAFAEVDHLHFEHGPEEDGSLRVLGGYLTVVSVEALVLVECCSQLLRQWQLPPSGNLVLLVFSHVTEQDWLALVNQAIMKKKRKKGNMRKSYWNLMLFNKRAGSSVRTTSIR